MKNLTVAIGLESIYQSYREFVPGYIGRVDFFVGMRKAILFKSANLVSSSAD